MASQKSQIWIKEAVQAKNSCKNFEKKKSSGKKQSKQQHQQQHYKPKHQQLRASTVQKEQQSCYEKKTTSVCKEMEKVMMMIKKGACKVDITNSGYTSFMCDDGNGSAAQRNAVQCSAMQCSYNCCY